MFDANVPVVSWSTSSDPLHFSCGAFAEGKVEQAARSTVLPPGTGKNDLAGRLIVDGGCELAVAAGSRRRCFGGGGNGERAAVEIELLQPQAARLLEKAAGDSVRLGAEEARESAAG